MVKLSRDISLLLCLGLGLGAQAAENGESAAGEANQSPVAEFATSSPEVSEPLKILLDASGSNDSDGTIIHYHWAINPPFQKKLLEQKKFALLFPEAGTYQVTLTVTDNGGLTHSITREVKVEANKAQASEYGELKQVVGEYLNAWQAEKFEFMHGLESWEGGQELSLAKYIQGFDQNFELKSWEIVRVKPGENDELAVIIAIEYNPPAPIAKMLPPGKTVRNGITQYWRKDGDNYLHLYHLERQRLMGPIFNRQGKASGASDETPSAESAIQDMLEQNKKSLPEPEEPHHPEYEH